MEKLIYSIKSFFASTEFLKFYDKTRKKLNSIVPKIIIYVLLICFSYVFIFPILRILVDSFKGELDLVDPDVVWIPKSIYFGNYTSAGTVLKLWRPLYEFASAKEGLYAIKSTLGNSIAFSFISAVLQTLVSGLAGYAFARFNFKFKKFWFAGLIISFIIPTQIVTLPRRMMLSGISAKFADPAQLFGITVTQEANQFNATFNLLQTTPLILVTLLGQGLNSAILIFIFFSFFKMIPQALDEAAQIDGANYGQIFYYIIVKMSTPTILVVFLFSFIWNWNDTFVLSQLMMKSTSSNVAYESLPQALGIFNYTISQGTGESGLAQGDSNNEGWKAAAIIISISPLLLLYAFTQRKFVEGIENTGVTGV